MSASLFLTVILVILTTVHTSPVFELLFKNQLRDQNSNYRRQARGGGFSRGYNDYKKICRVVNPDPYAFVGSNSYPAAPFCFP